VFAIWILQGDNNRNTCHCGHPVHPCINIYRGCVADYLVSLTLLTSESRRHRAARPTDVKVLGSSTARVEFLQYLQYSTKAQVLVQSSKVKYSTKTAALDFSTVE
jgi:hypothetical protein